MDNKRRTFLRFPNFSYKAVTLSYDDGVKYDRRLLEIISKYGLKCTFNINSGSYGKTEDSLRMTKETAVNLFKSFDCEIAVHGEHHVSLAEVDSAMAVKDIIYDRNELEKTFNCLVRGFAYANGSINDDAVENLKRCGIVYARTTKSSLAFTLPTDWLRLMPTAHHKQPDLFNLVDEFLKDYDENRFAWSYSPKLFYLWGHSYEFNDDNNWEIIEEFSKKIGGRNDVWYATNIEIYEYVKAYDSLVFSVDGERVYNPTCTDVYICYFNKNYLIPKGATVKIEPLWKR